MKGHLSPWLFVECETCDARAQLESGDRSSAIREAVALGWREIDHLWRCPACAARIRNR